MFKLCKWIYELGRQQGYREAQEEASDKAQEARMREILLKGEL